MYSRLFWIVNVFLLLPAFAFSQLQFQPNPDEGLRFQDTPVGEVGVIQLRIVSVPVNDIQQNVSLENEQAEFRADPANFVIDAGDVRNVEITFAPRRAANFQDNLIILAGNPVGGRLYRYDFQMVGRGIEGGDPELVITPWPAEISLVVDEEDGRDSESINVENAGDAALEFRLSEEIPWLTVSPRQVELEPGDDADIEFSTTGDLPENGRYQGVVQGFSNDPEREELEIEVELVVDIHVVSSQIISLANGWNMISSNHDFEQRFIDDDGPDMQLILADIIDHVFLIKNGRGRFCAPRIPFWGIDFWNSAEAYWIRVTSDVELEIVGPEIPFDREIHLAAGWSMISYYPNYDLTAQQAFADLNERDLLYIAKNGRGRFIYGELLDFNITPGDGFQVRVLEDCSFTYPPEPEEDVAGSVEGVVKPIHFNQPISTGANESILLTGVEGLNNTDGIEIACITQSGLIAGAVVLQGGSPWGMTVWGDDPTTDQIDGFADNEVMQFVMYNFKYDHDVSLTPRVTEGDMRYATDGLVILKLEQTQFQESSTGLPGRYGIGSILPNPFNNRAVVEFSIENRSSVDLAIFDLSGRRLITLVTGIRDAGHHRLQIDGSSLTTGMYLLSLQAGDSSYIRKLVLVK